MSKNDRPRQDGIDYSTYYLKNYKDKSVDYQNSYYEIYREEAKGNDVIYLNSPEITEKKPGRRAREYGMPAVAQQAVEAQQSHEPYVIPPKAKKRRMNGRRMTVLLLCVILMCFLFTLLFADIISGGHVLASIQEAILNRNSTETTYYTVEMTNFNDFSEARAYSFQLRAQGAAGYVINDGSYRVIADVYQSESDALSVLSKLSAENPGAKIYKLDIPNVKYNKFPGELKESVQIALTYAPSVYTDLSQISSELSQQLINDGEAKTKITLLKKKIEDLKNQFEEKIKGTNHENLIKIQLELIAAVSYVDNLLNDNLERPGLLCDIRYTNVMCINTYRALLNSFK